MAKVVFFPKPGDVPVEVCNIRYGKSMVYTQDTDTISTNADLCEFLCFKNNVAATIFINSVNSPNIAKASNFVGSGRVGLGVYFPTDRWFNPITDNYEVIPDYMATTWGASGAASFENAVQGQPKASRYPNHGQQMYDVTNGRLGLDVVTGAVGESGLQEFLLVAFNEKSHVRSIYGGDSVFSYRNGMNETPAIYSRVFLGGRNSGASISGDSYTGYGNGGVPTGINRVVQVNRPSSMRWWDFWHSMGGGTMTDANNYVISEFAKTQLNNGWFNDFTHWHTMTDHQVYFDLVGGLIESSDAYSCTYDEAIQYLFYKSFVKRLTAKEVGGKIKVYVDVRDLFKSDVEQGLPMETPMNYLKTPLSIRVDLSATSLAGKDVKCNTGGVLKSGNIVVFDLPLSNEKEGILSATIEESETPDYIDLSKPVINVSGNNITTNKPCKIVVWNSSNIASFRSDEYSASTSAELAGMAYVGAICERGQSTIISL